MIFSLSTLCVVAQALMSSADFFFKINFFEKFFHEYHQRVKSFRSRSGPTFCMQKLSASDPMRQGIKVSRRHYRAKNKCHPRVAYHALDDTNFKLLTQQRTRVPYYIVSW